MAESIGVSAAMAAPSRAECEVLDAADPLAPWRERFVLPEGRIYLDGNSLGPLPKATQPAMEDVIARQWGRDLITSWNRHGWVEAPGRVGDKIARLIGAGSGEVIVADSTSVNLFKLIGAAFHLRPERRVILSERSNFPTDLHVAQGFGELLGGRVELRLVDSDDLAGALDDEVALLLLTHVDYRSGRMHDMARLTAAAHDAGALVLWDLAHSAGAMPVDLNGAGVDLAVGCGYKYLNGGPGAPAFLFVARRWQEDARQPLTGWFGHEAPFAFETGHRPADGIRRFLTGTPSILSLTALEVGIDLLLEVDRAALRAKSVKLTELFIDLVEARCAGHGLELASPRESGLRGSQVSFRHGDGYPIMQALIERGVIGDFRAQDLLRFGLTPLTLRFVDVFDAVTVLGEVLATRAWDRPALRQRGAVT
jgi:kynureninase